MLKEFVNPDGMDSSNQTVSSLQFDGNTHENKGQCNDTSDRESSIESFHTNKSEFSNAGESELIDVDDIELSDEESWLYKSPKKLSSEDKAVNTYKWLQKDDKTVVKMDLQVAKSALVNKLNELQIQSSNLKKQGSTSRLSLDNHKCDSSKESVSCSKAPNGDIPVIVTKSVKEKICDEASSEKSRGNNLMNDVIDVHKIAKLQEERLKQSTLKFLSFSEKKALPFGHLSPDGRVESARLCKPLSNEALNVYSGKMRSNVFTVVPSYGMKKQSTFGSSTSLTHNQDLHRSSLPNISKGYYTLKPKRTKYPGDVKMQCPLPIYPTLTKTKANGFKAEVPTYESRSKLLSPPCDYRESRTLPSSYRLHSRNNSTKSLPRRESTPLLSCQKAISKSDLNRRESDPIHSKKILTTVSPTIQRCSPTIHRRASHSPSRRLPLSTVHNQSRKLSDNSVLLHNSELKLTSKLPSPATRSGIPVPSIQCMSRPSAEDESWNQDCF